MRIDWSSETADASEILINPRFSVKETEELRALLSEIEAREKRLTGHLWVATSGSTAESTAQIKWVALSKAAVLASARAVNEHLMSDASDIWMHVLPDFHVGGLGIRARSFLSGASVVGLGTDRWDPLEFHWRVQETRATLSALVPTQIYDLVSRGLTSPDSLRAIVVGGGALSDSLYRQARSLGWKLLPSYGSTECASQVATAELSSLDGIEFPRLKVLSHVEAGASPEGRLRLRGPSLFTGYAFRDARGPRFVDPRVDGWFVTEDFGSVDSEGYLSILGRSGDFVKIGGESVDLSRLTRILEEKKLALRLRFDCALIAVPDERLGHLIHLAVAGEVDGPDLTRLIESYHAEALPFERVRVTHHLKTLPRTALGKLIRPELLKLIV